ncbi:helix-hairpin-helix domain-containing protein [Christiangramia sp. SM2212]|uniref:Helix-hairpin-helix domain-containing protein n=1 Tax=Christiangramia sediminicola TaxID=3073267 RepID=A0ABU1ER98_9FLAO|nr:helix-hairpin-helix domain-containing protein [Christiangramia sp. SM2212]MDR5590921.1 helix-hairpin-helix domain-containing protein [Christiangramia sp. SM2212]
MKFLKSHFALSRSQQNGIFILLLLIIILQLFIFIDFTPESDSEKIDETEINNFRKQLDSINQLAEVRKDTIYPFNPNYLTDFKAYQIGMSTSEIDRLIVYRKSGKWINSIEDFKSVTKVHDSLLKKISPSFRFPEWTQKTKNKPTEFKKSAETGFIISDLNAANSEDLKKVNGVGDVLSERIVKYRNSIGGFRSSIQLKDVYGLSPEVIERIDEQFKIISKPTTSLLNINDISEQQLSEIPYFNARIAKEIISYRKLHEGISSFEELSKINLFPYDKIDRIKLYLAVE